MLQKEILKMKLMLAITKASPKKRYGLKNYNLLFPTADTKNMGQFN